MKYSGFLGENFIDMTIKEGILGENPNFNLGI